MQLSKHAAFIAIIALAGCATISEGTTQIVNVDTPGVANTQCVLSRANALPRTVTPPEQVSITRANVVLTVECKKEGYEVSSVEVQPSKDELTIFQFPIGYLVDGVSGARYTYPKTINIEMKAQQ